MPKTDPETLNRVIHEFENGCDPEYIEVVGTHFDHYYDSEEDDFCYEVLVDVQEKDPQNYENSTYCHPVADFGRERGLYLWDTITDWKQENITLRFRFE